MAARAVVYGTRFCGYCVAATRYLEARGLSVEYVAVDKDPALRAHMQRISGRSSVPQIFVAGRHVGGYTDLRDLDRSGELERWLQTAEVADDASAA